MLEIFNSAYIMHTYTQTFNLVDLSFLISRTCKIYLMYKLQSTKKLLILQETIVRKEAGKNSFKKNLQTIYLTAKSVLKKVRNKYRFFFEIKV